MIGTVFGTLWAAVGIMALPAGARLPMAVVVGLVSVGLLYRNMRGPAQSGQRRLFGKTAYRVAVILEIAAIFAASAILPRFGWQACFLQVVGLIVGLHFIGLWWATRAARFLVITAGMCCVSAIALVLPQVMHAIQFRDAATGFGNALVLWLASGGSQSRNA